MKVLAVNATHRQGQTTSQLAAKPVTAAALICNAMPGQDLYAAAFFPKELSDEEWRWAYFHRELTDQQLAQAHDLGANMARNIKDGQAQAYGFAALMTILEAGEG